MNQRSREGYLLIDHSAVLAPPVPGQVSGGQKYESATVTCAHCGRVVVLNPQRTRPRGFCRKCDAYICDSYECNLECRPLSQVFDWLEGAVNKGIPADEAIRDLRKDVAWLNGR